MHINKHGQLFLIMLYKYDIKYKIFFWNAPRKITILFNSVKLKWIIRKYDPCDPIFVHVHFHTHT